MDPIFIEIATGVIMFTAIVLALVVVILVARSQLVATGDVTIGINGDPAKSLTVTTGGKLLTTLAAEKLFLPSACGGQGSQGSSTPQPWSASGDHGIGARHHGLRREHQDQVHDRLTQGSWPKR